jgi:hypothetical protein
VSRPDAKDMLTHYIAEAWKRAGLKWDSDNIAEVESIVDSIAEAVKDEMHDEAAQEERDMDRFDAACVAMNGLLANPALCAAAEVLADDRTGGAATLFAQNAVRYADALLAELAKPKGGGA